MSEKWKVTFSFKFIRTIDETSDLYDNYEQFKKDKNPTKKQLFDYMNKENRYQDYINDLYLYGEYMKAPEIISFNKTENKITFLLDKINSENKIIYPDEQSIIDDLESQSLSDGIWEQQPGSSGVYPSSINSTYELGVIGFKNIKVKKILK